MTTPFDDPMFTLTPTLTTELPATASIMIPTSQRRTGDTIRDIALPTGLHQLHIQWRGPLALTLYVQTGTGTARTISGRLSGGDEAAPVVIPVVIGTPGGKIWFQAPRRATAEEVASPTSVMGLTVFLSEARKPLT